MTGIFPNELKFKLKIPNKKNIGRYFFRFQIGRICILEPLEN